MCLFNILTDWGFWTAVFTGLLCLLVWRQVVWSRKTLGEMVTDSNRREKFETAKLRAYINVDLAENFFHQATDRQVKSALMRQDWGGDGTRWVSFELSISNIGETPARDIFYSTNIVIHKQGSKIDPVEEVFHEEPFDVARDSSIIKASKIVNFPTSKVELLLKEPNVECFLFFGIVRYKDFIGNNCFTRFAYEVFFPTDGPPTGHKTQTHNEKDDPFKVA